jgi:hypothetical protein
MAEILQTVVTPLYFYQTCEGYTKATDPFYGTLTGAESYFRSKIKNTVRDWIDADDDDRVAALKDATRRIEALCFLGTPVGEQLHFPTEEDDTPDAIVIATYEVALKLLSGIDPDTEADNLSVSSQGYAGGRTTFDRSFVQAHVRSGIPSAYAWSILRPYLRDPDAIKLRRGD